MQRHCLYFPSPWKITFLLWVGECLGVWVNLGQPKGELNTGHWPNGKYARMCVYFLKTSVFWAAAVFPGVYWVYTGVHSWMMDLVSKPFFSIFLQKNTK